ncbi:MAG: LysM peptidoglycan-binding domain-containing protein [Candidatus Methylumidiphilus sp.]
MKLRTLCGLGLLLVAGLGGADEIELSPTHPERYIVARGDTLWDIAGKFLANPWQWPDIWHDNPQVADPHWIYPGDELALTVVDGHPRLQVARRYADADTAPAERPDEGRLSPSVRVQPLGPIIPTIPTSAIQAFLTQPKVVGPGDLEQAPYVVAMADEHVAVGAGDRVYVRGMASRQAAGYMLFRPGNAYLDSETGDVLGYEALYVAETDIQSFGEISMLRVLKSDRAVVGGDRVMPVEANKVDMRYQPHAPAYPIHGHIISVVDGVSQIGQWNVVVIDRGSADGVETGHVLQISQSGVTQRDFFSPVADDFVELPPEREGLLMVFRPYERVSFALVLSAVKAIHLNDAVLNP